MMENLAEAGEDGRWGGPFHSIYHHIESCSVRSSWGGRNTPPISSLPLCTLWLRLRNPPPPSTHPPYLGSYTRALLVSQDRRHLFVTLWYKTLDFCCVVARSWLTWRRRRTRWRGASSSQPGPRDRSRAREPSDRGKLIHQVKSRKTRRFLFSSMHGPETYNCIVQRHKAA